MGKPLRIKAHPNEVGIRLGKAPFVFQRQAQAPSILHGSLCTSPELLRDRIKCKCARCAHEDINTPRTSFHNLGRELVCRKCYLQEK